MATFKKIAVAYPNAASDTSLTSAFKVPPEFTGFVVRVPALFAATTTCAVYLQASDEQDGTYYQVMEKTQGVLGTGVITSVWNTPTSLAVDGGYCPCVALENAPGWARFQYANTATANTGAAIVVYGRKND